MFVERGWFAPTLQFGPDDVFIFEDWEETPVGPYRALFHMTPQDRRTLYASSREGGDLVSGIHRFDDVHITDIQSRREHGDWAVEVDTGERGALSIEIAYRETALLKAVNLLAPHIPQTLTRSFLYCRMLPRLAGLLLGTDPDQKIAGVTELGRESRFRLERVYMVTGGQCRWGDGDPDPLRDCCFQHDMGDFRPSSKPTAIYLALFVD